jgi:hypothetical protein
MTSVRISDIIDTSPIIEAALEHKLMRVTRAKQPNIDTMLKVAANTVEDFVKTHVAGEVQAKVQDAYDTMVLIDGEYAEAEDKDSWSSALDDKIEEAIEEYVPVLSADWLGRETIDTQLYKEGMIEKFCASLAKEYYKQITWDKSPAQVLSSAGIMRAELEAALETHLKTNSKGDTPMSEDAIDTVIAKIAEHVGADYDQLTIYDDFDQVTDDDDNLALGAAERLGLDEDDVETLRGERLVHGDEVMDTLTKKLEAHFGENIDGSAKPAKKGGKKAPAKKEAAPKKAASKKKEKPAPVASEDAEDEAALAESDELEGTVNAEVLQTIKKCGAIDTDMAKGLGVSRATYNNWANGKTEFEMTAEQQLFVRNEIVERITSLLNALATVDGQAEPQTSVF